MIRSEGLRTKVSDVIGKARTARAPLILAAGFFLNGCLAKPDEGRTHNIGPTPIASLTTPIEDVNIEAIRLSANAVAPDDGGGHLDTNTPVPTSTSTKTPLTFVTNTPVPPTDRATNTSTSTSTRTATSTSTATASATEPHHDCWDGTAVVVCNTATATKTPTASPTTKPEPIATPTRWEVTCTPEPECVPASEVKDILKLARANWPYDAIVALDAHPAKVDHPVGGFTLSANDNPGIANDETQLFWSGRYNAGDITDGGRTATVSRDGLTGIFALRTGNDLVVSSPAGSLCVTGLDIDRHDVTASGSCVPNAEIISAINNGRPRTDGQIFVNLDEIANRYPFARLRADFAPDTVLPGGPLTRLLWIQEGRLSGTGILPIDIRMGMGAYLLTDNSAVTANWPHSGIVACEPINPQIDFPWWGR